MIEASVEGWNLLLSILGIMLVMGLFGGFVNFLLTAKSDPEQSLLKSLCAGIAASILVPLFLNTIGSNLLTSAKMPFANLLVLAGFCLIAAISSRAFMKSLAERLLQEAREVNMEVKEQAEKVEELISEPEREPVEQTTGENRQGAEDSLPPHLEPNMIAVLKALLDTRFVMRTFSGIAMDTRLSTAEVGALLTDMEKRGLVQVVHRPRGVRAVITAQGREALMKASS